MLIEPCMVQAKMRKEDLEWARLNQSEQEAKLKAEAEETEQRIKEHAQRKMELIHRWVVLLAGCSMPLYEKQNIKASKAKRLIFPIVFPPQASHLAWHLQPGLKTLVHPMRELRRRAAATIADWYKALLDKRLVSEENMLRKGFGVQCTAPILAREGSVA
eukprot:scaffold237695_cov19-Tisochrysis_lutea.AAC.1